MFDAKIVLDSVSPTGVRLTTMEVTFPRIILAELNTHRMFSRNSASSRAIPVEKMLQKVLEEPFVPVNWGKNQKGMQADQELNFEEQIEAMNIWLAARNHVIGQVNRLIELGVHKQITNRLLEPWLFHTVLVTATEWDNFFALRTHRDAQPEMQVIAKLMNRVYEDSMPYPVDYGDWHLPLLPDGKDLIRENYSLDQIIKISVGRCARVSYLTHHGARDPKADIELAEKLLESGHMSPFEHVATPMVPGQSGLPGEAWSGNFMGWEQYRKILPNEENYGARKN